MKKIITVHFGERQEFETDSIGSKTHIEDLIEWLDEMLSEGAKYIEWDGKKDWDGVIETIYARAFDEREETNKEYNSVLMKQIVLRKFIKIILK